MNTLQLNSLQTTMFGDPGFSNTTSSYVFHLLDKKDMCALVSVNRTFASTIHYIFISTIFGYHHLILSVDETIPVFLQLREIHCQTDQRLPLNNRVVFSGAIKNGYKKLLTVIFTRSLYRYDVDKTCSDQSIDINNIALLRAADYGRADMLPWLLEMGADVNAQEPSSLYEQAYFEQSKPLDMDAYDRYFESCDLHERCGGFRHTTNWMHAARLDYGQTALIHAARHGHTNMIKLLLQAKADMERRTACGWTAVTEAVTHQHGEALSLLLTAKANPNACTDDRITALMEAAHGNFEAGVRLLLKAKADVELLDTEACSVRDYVTTDNTVMQELLMPRREQVVTLTQGGEDHTQVDKRISLRMKKRLELFVEKHAQERECMKLKLSKASPDQKYNVKRRLPSLNMKMHAQQQQCIKRKLPEASSDQENQEHNAKRQLFVDIVQDDSL